MKPMLLAIRRKILVPVKHFKYTQAYIFRQVHRCYFNVDKSTIKTESQFAKWIYDSFGDGIYNVVAYVKGRRGFISFWYGHCESDGFVRLRAKVRFTKTLVRKKQEVLKLRDKLEKSEDVQTREDLKGEIASIMEEIEDEKSFEKIIVEKKKRGPTPYLIPSTPVGYKFSYDDY